MKLILRLNHQTDKNCFNTQGIYKFYHLKRLLQVRFSDHQAHRFFFLLAFLFIKHIDLLSSDLLKKTFLSLNYSNFTLNFLLNICLISTKYMSFLFSNSLNLRRRWYILYTSWINLFLIGVIKFLVYFKWRFKLILIR